MPVRGLILHIYLKMSSKNASVKFPKYIAPFKLSFLGQYESTGWKIVKGGGGGLN